MPGPYGAAHVWVKVLGFFAYFLFKESRSQVRIPHQFFIHHGGGVAALAQRPHD